MRGLGRRQVLRGMAVAAVGLAWSGAPVRAASDGSRVGSEAFTRLMAAVQVGIDRDAEGLQRVFGFSPEVADEVLQAVTKVDGLSPGYVPRDLVGARSSGLAASTPQYVRAIIVPDTRAMLAAAAAEGHVIEVGSAYRSYSYQETLFAAQVARRGGDEEGANRFSARPGHSQHQLGTTIDFWGEALFRAFGVSPAGRWLWSHAHEYGFVFPYTENAAALTGYVSEPWHARWVGRDLARWMEAAGYQDWADLSADDVVAAVRIAAGFAPDGGAA